MMIRTDGFYASEPISIEDEGYEWTANGGMWFDKEGRVFNASARNRRVQVSDFTDRVGIKYGELSVEGNQIHCTFNKGTIYTTEIVYEVRSPELLIHTKSGERYHFIALSESELKSALEIFDQKAKKS